MGVRHRKRVLHGEAQLTVLPSQVGSPVRSMSLCRHGRARLCAPCCSAFDARELYPLGHRH